MELSQNDIQDNIIHFITNEGNDNVANASYNKEEDVWMVGVYKEDYGHYMFMGKISPEGIPLEGSISHDGDLIMFHNNKKLFNNNFKDTIIYLWQDEKNKTAGKINNDNNNEYCQTYNDGYEYTFHKEVDERQEKKNKVFKKYFKRSNYGHQPHWNSYRGRGRYYRGRGRGRGRGFGRGGHFRQQYQQPQNKSNLNLRNSQNRKFGLGGDN